MQYIVKYKDKPVGTAFVEHSGTYTSFKVACEFNSLDVFRCYAIEAGLEPLLIGVLEPVGGKLIIDRKLSDIHMSEKGYKDIIPTQYYILTPKDRHPDNNTINTDIKSDDLKENNHLHKKDIDKENTTSYNWNRTGDSIIDSILLKVDKDENNIFCEFNNKIENPLAFALTACTIQKREEKYYCVLNIKDIREQNNIKQKE